MKLKMSRGWKLLSSRREEGSSISCLYSFPSSRVFYNFLKSHPSGHWGNYETNKCSPEGRLVDRGLNDWQKNNWGENYWRETCWTSIGNDRSELSPKHSDETIMEMIRKKSQASWNKHSRIWFERNLQNLFSKLPVNLFFLKFLSSHNFPFCLFISRFEDAFYCPTSSRCVPGRIHYVSLYLLCNRCVELQKSLSRTKHSPFVPSSINERQARRLRDETKCVKWNRQSVGTITRTVCVDNWSVWEKEKIKAFQNFFTQAQKSQWRLEEKPVRLIDRKINNGSVMLTRWMLSIFIPFD